MMDDAKDDVEPEKQWTRTSFTGTLYGPTCGGDQRNPYNKHSASTRARVSWARPCIIRFAP
jgi:hypothetical protein